MKKTFLILLAAGLVFSCSEKTFKKEQVLTKGIELYKKGEYDDAKEYLKKAIYKAPNMTTADIMEARYYLANIYYQQGNYIDAIVEFEEYLALFPTSPKVPEVLYKLAVSYLKISPSPDRDLTYVRKALEKAEELIDNYPDSPYAKKALEIIKQAKKMEAQHLIGIAYLYEKLGKHYSASVYYNMVFDEYPDQIEKDYIIYKIAYNLANTHKQYEDKIEEYRKKIKKLEEEINGEKDLEKKNVLLNRKKLLEAQLNKLLDRIREGREKAVSILKHGIENYPDSKYKKQMKELLKELTKEG
ncbi:MAG: outer membrane protein assembly factor BamD [Aquificae bacterium]|nr:outer membrane protein assembly factor BamD [Aquificota bacterium]